MELRRRQFLAMAASSTLGVAAPGLCRNATAETAAETADFGFAQVRELAERLAQTDYAEVDAALPAALLDLDREAYQQIRFRQEHALWSEDNVPFRVVFRHLGSFYRRSVKVNVIDQGQAAPVAYRSDWFDFGVDGFVDQLPEDLGFAGLTLHHRYDDPAKFPEFATFHGASYFRVIGKDQQYGLSARGLALDTGLPSGEEFPFFREIWLQRPEPGAGAITIHALLDSPSVTGAYRFVMRPGIVATVEVQAALFVRRAIAKLGIAPLTSMFLYGENRGRRFDDFRPEVHDSDGLLIHNGRGEWLWRPLANHRALQISAFLDEQPRGFGLFQRDLGFQNYQDLGARFHLRPSMWVEPIGEWGPGAVELIEIPSDHEDNDNIVAFWVPETPVEAGQQLDFAYRIHTQLDQPRRPPLGRVEATRIGPGQNNAARRFFVDFSGGSLDQLGPGAPLEPQIKAHQGEFGAVDLRRNPEIDGWRLSFDLDPKGRDLCEMRAFLQLQDERVTEIWTYRWTPI